MQKFYSTIENFFKFAASYIRSIFILDRISVIIPCLNEEKTVSKVVRNCLNMPLVSEVIVVDDGSTDNSSSVAEIAGAKVVKHEKNMGKGAAIRTGIENAKNNVLVFIDADLVKVDWFAIERLALPIIFRKATLSKASFSRSAGRVTELTAKPLLGLLFPEIELKQPLSGQFAVRKDFLQRIEVINNWGVDVGILLDAVNFNEPILEVDIGSLEHKHRSLEELSGTARGIAKTILQKAGFFSKKHKLIVFDFDRTLIKKSSIEVIANTLGFHKELDQERAKYYSGKITERALTKKIGKMLSGISPSKLAEIASKLEKQQFAEETILYLKRMGYKIAIVSFAFRGVIEASFNPKASFDEIICPLLTLKNGNFNGRVNIPQYYSRKYVFSKGKAILSLMKKYAINPDEVIAVGDSVSDNAMFSKVDCSVAISSKPAVKADLRIKSLPELIVIAN